MVTIHTRRQAEWSNGKWQNEFQHKYTSDTLLTRVSCDLINSDFCDDDAKVEGLAADDLKQEEVYGDKIKMEEKVPLKTSCNISSFQGSSSKEYLGLTDEEWYEFLFVAWEVNRGKLEIDAHFFSSMILVLGPRLYRHYKSVNNVVSV